MSDMGDFTPLLMKNMINKADALLLRNVCTEPVLVRLGVDFVLTMSHQQEQQEHQQQEQEQEQEQHQ